MSAPAGAGTIQQLAQVREKCARINAWYLSAPRRPADHQALARRRAAALRLPPLPCGHRDPLDCS